MNKLIFKVNIQLMIKKLFYGINFQNLNLFQLQKYKLQIFQSLSYLSI